MYAYEYVWLDWVYRRILSQASVARVMRSMQITCHLLGLLALIRHSLTGQLLSNTLPSHLYLHKPIPWYMILSLFYVYVHLLMYSYSKREQTYAGLFMQDDVPEEVKGKRLTEVISAFYDTVYERNKLLEVRILSISINNIYLFVYMYF